VTELAGMTNPFENEQGEYFVLVNEEEYGLDAVIYVNVSVGRLSLDGSGAE
jgi:hypothetical protein